MNTDSKDHMGRILITGGAGFIGLSLAWHLRKSADLILLDSLRHRVDFQNQWANSCGAKLVVGDVRDADLVLRCLDGCNCVVHLASLAGVDRVRTNPGETSRTILDGTKALLDACSKSPNIKRIVVASTSEVYGINADRDDEYEFHGPLPDDDPRWIYAASKLVAERMVLNFGAEHGLDAFIVRPFNVYGPGQLGRGAVETFVKRALAAEPLEVFNGGEQVRAWCFITDLLKGLEAILLARDLASNIYNMGNPYAALTTRQLASKIVHLAQSKSTIRSRQETLAEVQFRVPNISRAETELGFGPAVDLEQGLIWTIAWYKHLLDGSPVAPWEGDFGL